MPLITRVNDGPEPEGVRQPKPYNAPRTITAAATRVSVNDVNEVERIARKQMADKWQQEAWEYFDLIGEIKYAYGLIGSIMSRIRLYPAQITGGNVIPSPLEEIEGLPEGLVEASQTTMQKLATTNGGIPGLLRDASINILVTGECSLIQVPARPALGIPEKWDILSVDELVATPGNIRKGSSGFSIKPRSNSGAQDYVPLPSGTFMGRIWKVHPRYSDEADSNMKPLLSLMDELLLLDRTFRTTERSRLPAGAVYIPDEISAAADDDGESEETDIDGTIIAPYSSDESDTFEENLIDALSTPISDEMSAASQVPLIMRGPADMADKIKVIKFERSVDPSLVGRSGDVLGRILNGLDIPRDFVLSSGNGVRAGSETQLEDAVYKHHVEPLCLMLCDALTVVFFRPILRALGFPEDVVEKAVLWYDPSSVSTKPDKATAADTGYANKTLSADAWRRAHGFSDTDAPTPMELAQRIAVERGQLSEPITEALFRSLIPELLKQVREQSQADNPSPLSPQTEQALGTADGLDGSSIPDEQTPSDQATASPSDTPPSGGTPPAGLIGG